MEDINAETNKRLSCSIVRDGRFRLSLRRIVFIPCDIRVSESGNAKGFLKNFLLPVSTLCSTLITLCVTDSM